jgi:hypothetical protein
MLNVPKQLASKTERNIAVNSPAEIVTAAPRRGGGVESWLLLM